MSPICLASLACAFACAMAAPSSGSSAQAVPVEATRAKMVNHVFMEILPFGRAMVRNLGHRSSALVALSYRSIGGDMKTLFVVFLLMTGQARAQSEMVQQQLAALAQAAAPGQAP